MENVLQVISVNDYARYVGAPVLHPLVSVVNYDELDHCRHALIEYGVYALFLMKESPYTISYGGGNYEFQSGSLMCVAPGQRCGVTDNGETIHIKGWVLLFHPDLLSGTHLERKIKDCHYFSYFSMELAARFYERQFKEAGSGAGDFSHKIDTVLERYYAEEKQSRSGIPTVRYYASALFLSPNYFGDLVRARTGESATLYIRHFLMRRAKGMLMEGLPVADVSDALGFAYPQHFTQMFKKEYNVAPSKIARR